MGYSRMQTTLKRNLERRSRATYNNELYSKDNEGKLPVVCANPRMVNVSIFENSDRKLSTGKPIYSATRLTVVTHQTFFTS